MALAPPTTDGDTPHAEEPRACPRCGAPVEALTLEVPQGRAPARARAGASGSAAGGGACARPPEGHAMMLRLECDFRHGLVYPAITREADGPVVSFAHGDAYIAIALSDHSLRALWLAVAASVGEAEC